jgi:phosphoglycerate dehydrogenase-like enzyme
MEDAAPDDYSAHERGEREGVRVTRSGQADTTYAEKIVPVSELHQVLPYADFVVIAAPETPEPGI